MSGPLYPTEPQAVVYPQRKYQFWAGVLTSFNIFFTCLSVGALVAEARFGLMVKVTTRDVWMTIWLIMAFVGFIVPVSITIHNWRWRKAFFFNNEHLRINRRALKRASRTFRADSQNQGAGDWKDFYGLVAETLDNAGHPKSVVADRAHQVYIKQIRAPH